VALVLGAGNISSIAPLDVAYKLFVEDQVAVLKMNPVNEFLGPFLERAFRSLIDDGYLGVAYGGQAVGEFLCHDDRVDTIHLTGSDRTHDAIVWGVDPAESSRRKAAGEPLLHKPVTSELGSVTPILVVPGRWSASDLAFQTRHVASMVAHNASFNCNAGKVVALARGWKQRDEFLDRLDSALASTPPRRAYYPGAHDRYENFLRHYPRARAVGEAGDEVVPWTIIPDVPAVDDEYALNNEAFCGVLAEVSLDADDAPTFLSRAVEFANEKVWGTLSCVVLVDPVTERAHADTLEAAVADLRYGGIGINIWTGVNFGLGVTTWGAFPGHPPENIESGSGVVHNALLFDHPQKSVLRAGFRIWPKPVWFSGHRTLLGLGRDLTHFEAHRSPVALLKVALAGLRA
jgi:acyl-CoA reductase-like NAD-dependent aldehyde dehydrogenase